jgi:hypothetical protein
MNYTQLAPILPTLFRPQIISAFNARSTLLQLIRKQANNDKQVTWPLQLDGAMAEKFSDGATVSTVGSTTKKGAILDWAKYRTNFEVTDFAQDVSASRDAFDAIANEFLQSIMFLASTVNQKLYTGDGVTADEFAGLIYQIKDDNTWAGIDRTQAANALARSKITDPGVLTAPTTRQIRDDIGAIYDACGEGPNFAMCPTAVFNKLVELFDVQRFYVQEVMGANGPVRFNAGVAGVEIEGCTFVKDKDCQANTIWYLNTNYIELNYTVPKDSPAPLDGVNVATTPINDGYGAIPLGARVKRLGPVGSKETFMASIHAQLKLAKPSAFGARKNVQTT